MPTTKKRVGSKRRDTRGQKRCPHCGALVPARWFGRHLAEKHGSAAQLAASQVTVPAQSKSAVAKNVTARMKQTISHRKELQCPHCDKTFAVLSGLASHLHYLHPDKLALERPGQATTPARRERPSGPTSSVVKHWFPRTGEDQETDVRVLRQSICASQFTSNTHPVSSPWQIPGCSGTAPNHVPESERTSARASGRAKRKRPRAPEDGAPRADTAPA